MKPLAAIVLAAGASRRMGSDDKLLTNLHGKPLIGHIFVTLSKLGLEQVVVVGAANHEALQELCHPFGFRVVRNLDQNSGMGTSIATGAAELDDSHEGVFICLGDMPWIELKTFDLLAQQFAASEGTALDAVVPTFKGQQGHPVLFSNRLFPALAKCQGDRGARHLLQEPNHKVAACPVQDQGIVTDIDTPEDLIRFGKSKT